MRRRTALLVATAAAVVAGGGVVAVVTDDGGAGRDIPTLREYPLGDRPAAPPIGGELLGGGQYDLADRRGEVVVVNVWASWCGPCRAESDDLEQAYQATKDLGVSFVGVNIEDGRDAAERFQRARASYPSIYDPPFENGLHFRDPPAPIGPPATLVVDRTGHLAVAIYRQVGRIELERAITRVAAEEAPGDG